MYFLTLIGISMILYFTSCKKGPEEKIELWNGKNLNGWVTYLKTDTIDADSVWKIENGVIHCSGNPFGYIRTEKIYNDYTLHVEWRWPKKPGNSGVFLHIQEKDTIFPTCVEAQLMAGKAGDFVAMKGAKFNELSENSIVLKKKEPSSENEPGEWNEYDIACSGDTIKLIVNDVFQNIVTGVNVTSGYIGLQSEGAPIEFRNIYLKPGE